jgi:hypothetical protein
MPRARLPQLQSITDGSFEPARKNPISLAEDSFLDDHQKPIRIGESASPLSLSKNQIRIDGDFHLEGNLKNPLLQTDFEYLELRPEENVRFTSKNSTGSLDLFISSGTPFFVASGSNFNLTTSTAGIFSFGSLGNISMFTFDVVNSKFLIQDADDSGDSFSIQTNTHGATDIITVDDDATAAHLVVDIDGDITLDAASGNITAKDNGGNYTPSSDYHVATKKYVDDNAGGGGASALNDLSDVSYSSGDLTITSLDTIIAGGDLTLDVDGDINLDANGGFINLKDDGTTFGLFSTAGSKSGLILYESAGASTNDFFFISTSANGATLISTIDAAGTSANLTINPDGGLNLTPATEVKSDTPLKIAETANALTDTAGYGQIWVDSQTPNCLAFTDDAGTDIIGVGKYHYETKVIGYAAFQTTSILPITGYVFEGTTGTSRNEFLGFLAPYNCRIEKFCFRSEIAQNGTLILRVVEAQDETEVPGTQIYRKDHTIDIADDTFLDLDMTSPGLGSDFAPMTKGRLYSFQITTPSNSADTNVTIVFRHDITS